VYVVISTTLPSRVERCSIHSCCDFVFLSTRIDIARFSHFLRRIEFKFLVIWLVKCLKLLFLNYWVIRLCPSSGILETRKHRVTETGYLSILRWEWKTRTLLVPWERDTLSHWTETDAVSETLCFLACIIPDDGQRQKIPVILSVIHHSQNLLDSTYLFCTLPEVLDN
jgi:hypothetical protein